MKAVQKKTFGRDEQAIDVEEAQIELSYYSAKYFAPGVYEVKRVFVDKEYRSRGVASGMMRKLEELAIAKGHH